MDDLDWCNIHKRDWNSYEELRDEFQWEVPENFNTAQYVCDRWAMDESRTAVHYTDEVGNREGTYTFRELKRGTNRLANYLRLGGIEKDDRIAVNMSQKPETVLAYIAAWKVGAVVVPLSNLFGPTALEYRLTDCKANCCIVDGSNVEDYRRAAGAIDSLKTTIVVGETDCLGDEVEFRDVLSEGSSTFEPTETRAEDDMLILYTSGTTGDPKGVVQSHAATIGQLPGAIANYYNFEVRDTDVRWIPSDWTWAASISTVLMALYFGRPVVAHERDGKFDPETAFSLIERYRITIPLLPPTALRMMMGVDDPRTRYDLDSVRLIVSGGESVGTAVSEWAADVFDARVHEGYGQSEAWNMIVGDCTKYKPFRAGWMGYPLPGHDVAVLDPETHEPIDRNEVGELAVRADDPTVFKAYWNQPAKTAEKFSGDWMLTEDLVKQDTDGAIQFVSRKDEVILSAGYRISPVEVENAVLGHDAVADVGVVGVPDDERGEVPKAVVVLQDGYEGSDTVRTVLKSLVRDSVAAYAYPREVEFVEELPKTTSGKIQRTKLR